MTVMAIPALPVYPGPVKTFEAAFTGQPLHFFPK
jgi:hypothetical protein